MAVGSFLISGSEQVKLLSSFMCFTPQWRVLAFGFFYYEYMMHVDTGMHIILSNILECQDYKPRTEALHGDVHV